MRKVYERNGGIVCQNESLLHPNYLSAECWLNKCMIRLTNAMLSSQKKE